MQRAPTSCSPPRGVAANCAAQRAAEARPIWFRTFVQFCRVRAAASGPGIKDAPPQARRLCEPHEHRIHSPPPFCEVRPRRAPHAPLMRRPRRGRRSLAESRYSLSAYSSSLPAGAQPSLRKCHCLSGSKPAEAKTSIASCGPPRSEASARATLRVAEAQPKVQPNVQPNPPPQARPSATGKPITVFASEEQAQPKTRPSSPPRISLTAAPLSLRHIPVARWDFISILLSQNE